MKLRILIAAILICCIQSFTGEDVVELMTAKYNKIKSYRAEIIENETKRTILVLFKKPNKARIEFDESIAIVNGSYICIYNRSGVVKAHYSGPADMYYGYILSIIRNQTTSLVGEEKVSGRDCYVLEFDSGKVWVVKGMWYPAKVLLKADDKVVMEYKSIDFDVDINDSEFSCEPWSSR